MRAARSIEAYLETWRDSYVIERLFCAFHASPDLFGVIVWGRPDVNQARAIHHAREAELRDPGRHRVVLDYRSVEVVDQDAFVSTSGWMESHRSDLALRTSKVALVQPNESFAAAIVAGFYRVVTPPYPSQLCATIEEADVWLGGNVAERVAAMREQCAVGSPTTTNLVRAFQRFPHLGIEEAARELGITSRTLQRRLHDEGTTFRAVARKEMLRYAKVLLSTTDEKIGEVARAVGCASAQHFTEIFRMETGMTPAAWRAHARREVGHDDDR